LDAKGNKKNTTLIMEKRGIKRKKEISKREKVWWEK